MMCEIMDTFTSGIFAQFRIIHVLDAWGMFAQACAPLLSVRSCPTRCADVFRASVLIIYYVVYLYTYLDTSVAYHKYYRKL